MSRYDKDGLTIRQRDIYDYIVQFKITNGYSPTMREISAGVLTSRSFVRESVHILCDKHILSYDPTKFRSIVVTKFLL